MAARGGARIGAGRPKNVHNKPSALREKNIAESGMTPLQVMIDNMRVAYENALKSEQELKEIQLESMPPKDAFELLLNAVRRIVSFRHIAQACAKDAAVFVHPRLAQVEVQGEIKHDYVLRVPPAVTSVAEWQEQHSNKQQTIQ